MLNHHQQEMNEIKFFNYFLCSSQEMACFSPVFTAFLRFKPPELFSSPSRVFLEGDGNNDGRENFLNPEQNPARVGFQA